MKLEILSEKERELINSQLRFMDTESVLSIISDCYSRIGSHYVLSDTPDLSYLKHQRDIALLALMHNFSRDED